MLASSNTISCWYASYQFYLMYMYMTETWKKNIIHTGDTETLKTFHETFFISASRLAPSQLAPSRLAPSQLYGEWKAITLPVTTGANIMFHALKNTQTQFIVCLCVCITNYDLTVLFSNNLT